MAEKELKAACAALVAKGVLTESEGGFVLTANLPSLAALPEDTPLPPIRAFHRNDCLVRAYEHDLTARFKPLCSALPYDHDPQYYVMVEGVFRALSVGHFRYGPYEIHDIVCDSPDMWERRAEICAAVLRENAGSVIQRVMGQHL